MFLNCKRVQFPIIIIFLFCVCNITNAQTLSFQNSLTTIPSQAGAFSVIKNNDKIYFAIPDSLLGKDIAIVSRIVKTSSNDPNLAFYAGELIGYRIIQFNIEGNKILLRKIYDPMRSKKDALSGVSYSIRRNYIQPIAISFDLISIGSSEKSMLGNVIDVSDFLNSDSQLLFFDGERAKAKPLGFQKDKSYLVSINSRPQNVEIQFVKTYHSGNDLVTFQLSCSFYPLPKNKMATRQFDNRVGFQKITWTEYDETLLYANTSEVIKRWRIEPKIEDVENYRLGKLVEPQQPIVFYIDPGVPKKWVKYIQQGVKDWQKAFEKAGFKNAIYAQEVTQEEAEKGWSIGDLRYNSIIWIPTSKDNANGQVIVDPRTGEILQAQIYWNYNELKWNQATYFVLAPFCENVATKFGRDEDFIGNIVRCVISHEVGHTLGLDHNFGASSTVSVEKLREKKWVEEYGFCPSIMDYARFNYVAQPEDSISARGLFPRVGEYDMWAIEWGYRIFDNKVSNDMEADALKSWTNRMIRKNKLLWFSDDMRNPDVKIEDIGDNSIIASKYGLLNLKRAMAVLSRLREDSSVSNNYLIYLYERIVDYYKYYINHVVSYIGSFYTTQGNTKLDSLQFAAKELQSQAMDFINTHLFQVPEWLIRRDLFLSTGIGNIILPERIQIEVLNKLISQATFDNLLSFERVWGSNAYRIKDLLGDFIKYIFAELAGNESISSNKLNLQNAYINRLTVFLSESMKSPEYYYLTLMLVEHLNELETKIKKSIAHYRSPLTQVHLKRILSLLSPYTKK